MNDDLQPTARKIQRAEAHHEDSIPLDQPHPEELRSAATNGTPPEPSDQPDDEQGHQQVSSPDKQQSGNERQPSNQQDVRPEYKPKEEAAASEAAEAEAQDSVKRSIVLIGMIGGGLLVVLGLLLVVLRLFVLGFIFIVIGLVVAGLSAIIPKK